MAEMKIFKRISIGGVGKEELLKQLIDRGVQFNKYAHTLFEHTAFSIREKIVQVNLVRVNLHDLGISQPCTFAEIVSKASELDLNLCPLYLGAFLRLEYMDQAEGPYLTVASLKPENDENFPNGFYVRNIENSLWLRGYRASDDYEWPVESEFIFLQNS